MNELRMPDDDWFVDAGWLADNLGKPGLVVLDSSWQLKDSGLRGIDDYERAHSPGARFFDIEKIADLESPYSTMLPPSGLFGKLVGELGIDNETLVVVSDWRNVSTRCWFMFRAFGHERIRILNGGNRKWQSEGRPMVSGMEPAPEPRRFTANYQPQRLIDRHGVLAALSEPEMQIADARTAPRFTGEIGSSHGTVGGHMPGAINIPYTTFVVETPEGGFVSRSESEAILRARGLTPDRTTIATCGSGISATVVGLMLERLGWPWVLYDGSWNEWAQQPELPKVLPQGEKQ